MSSSLHNRVIDVLGRAVIESRSPAGTVLHSEDIAQTQGVSRSVVREAIRVLASMGLVESVRRIGIRVLPQERWNAYDPTVIRWRLEGDSRGAQLRSLTELRSAVEPMAAELAAQHCPEEVSAQLMAVAAQMRTVGRSGDLARFLELDILFHRLVLHGSGNEMFASLDEPIGAVLSGRTDLGLMPTHPHETALQWHVDVADAIQGGHPSKARAAMELIMRRTIAEVEPTWADTPRPYFA